MNAEEARKRTSEKATDKVAHQYNAIQRTIEAAARIGQSYSYYYVSLMPGVKILLEQDGFKVDEIKDRDGILVTISW